MNNNEIITEGIIEMFQVGQKLSLTRSANEETENYPSYVKDYDDDFVFIDLPAKGGIPVPVYEYDEIQIAIITKEGIWVGDSLIEKVESGRIGGLWITYPESLKKIQRRDFMRWDLEFPTKIQLLKPSGNTEEIKSDCRNLSGGGIAIQTKTAIPRRSELRVEFKYNEIEVASRVKFIHAQYDSLKKNYITGLCFVELDKKAADKIHKIGVMKQLDLRRKGLL